ncbi:MAG: xylulose kinase, partial [archaeon]|nr:xylulose kinase [archaeon]
MSEKKYIISYDHGTSGMKTALISTKGEIKGFCVEEYELYHPEPGAAEQNPHEWWDALVKTTKDLLSKNLVPIEDIVAVVQSNQMSGTIAIDKDGNTLTNCLTWMDTRGGPMIHKLTGGIIKISGFGITNLLRWLPKTGGIPLPGGKDCIAHILYIKEKHPEIYEKTWKFLDCKDYLAYRLTGKTVTSHDLALFTWCMNNQDVNNIHWDESLIKKT